MSGATPRRRSVTPALDRTRLENTMDSTAPRAAGRRCATSPYPPSRWPSSPRCRRRPDPAGRRRAGSARLPRSRVSYGTAAGETVKGNFLGYNDFHGNIDPPTGSGGLVNGTPGRRRRVPRHLAEEAARRGPGRGTRRHTHRRRRRQHRGQPAGQRRLPRRADDRAAERDRRWTISSVGNHEFDEGVDELLRHAERRLPPGRRLPGRRRLRRRDVPVPGGQHGRQGDRPADPAAGRRSGSSAACRSASSA